MCTGVYPTFFCMMCACGGVCVFFVGGSGVRSDGAHFFYVAETMVGAERFLLAASSAERSKTFPFCCLVQFLSSRMRTVQTSVLVYQ